MYGGAAAIVGGAGLYLVDEDPITRPGVRVHEYYRDSAPPGIALGAVGILSLGFGLWWSHRTRSSVTPAVSLGPSGAMIGWGGRF
jgi:hypothetical protein